MDLSSMFDGLGSSVIAAIAGAVVTALFSIPISYKAGQRSVKQSQKAGKSSKQIQIGVVNERNDN
jgi:hypothetical protein